MHRFRYFVLSLIVSLCACGSIQAQSTFQDWQNQYFTSEQLSDTAVSGPNATPQGDGVPNLTKYAFGLDPTQPAYQSDIGTVFWVDEYGYPNLSYPQNLNAQDIIYVPEVSLDMQTWNRGPSWLPQTATTEGTNGWQTTTVSGWYLPWNTTHAFCRVTILLGGMPPDSWILQYFGSLNGFDPNALSPNGDGNTILQDYLLGLNPQDYYDSVLPTLQVVSGGSQTGSAGTVLPIPVSIAANGGSNNAPMTVNVTSGGATISADSQGLGGWGTTLNLTANSYVNLPDGSQPAVAQVYVQLSSTPGDVSTLTISASTSGQSTSVQTWVASSDPTMAVPTNLAAVPTALDTVNLSWTPGDASKSTTLQASLDNGNSWWTVGAAAPGATTATVTGLPSDGNILFQALTGGTSSSGTSLDFGSSVSQPPSGQSLSSPSNIASAMPLSQPLLLSGVASASGQRNGWSGFDDDQETDPVYTQWVTQVTQTISENNKSTATLTMNWTSQGVTSSESGDTSLYTYFDVDTVPSGPTSASWTSQDGTITVVVTLSQAYSSSQLASNVYGSVGQPPPFTSGTSNQGMYEDYYQYGVENLTIGVLSYQWQVNSDPNLVVYWDIVFVPDDNSGPQYTQLMWASAGQTISPVFVVDPVQLHPNTNGTYYVTPFWVKVQQPSLDANGNITGNPAVKNVRLCRWLTQRDPTTWQVNRATFPTGDPDAITITMALPDQTGKGQVTVSASTTGGVLPGHSDTGQQLTLQETAPGFFTTSLALVTDSDDTNLALGNPAVSHGQPGYPLLLASLGGQLVFSGNALPQTPVQIPIQKPSNQINPIFLILDPTPNQLFAPTAEIVINQQLKRMQEIYAMIGLQVNPGNYLVLTQSDMQNIDQSTMSTIQKYDASYPGLVNLSTLASLPGIRIQETIDALCTTWQGIFASKGGTVPNNPSVIVMFNGNLQTYNPDLNAGITVPNPPQSTFPKTFMCFINTPTLSQDKLNRYTATIAHELGHLIGIGSDHDPRGRFTAREPGEAFHPYHLMWGADRRPIDSSNPDSSGKFFRPRDQNDAENDGHLYFTPVPQ